MILSSKRYRMRQQKIVIKNDPKALKTLRNKLKSFLVKSDFPKKDQWHFLMAVGEACTNSMAHSYGKDVKGSIRVSAMEFKDKIVFNIRDYGEKINLKKIKSPKLPPKKPHGLGIYFLKTIMDELKYNTTHPKGNELTLIKYKPRMSR